MNKLIFLGTGNARNLERQLTSLCFVAGTKIFLVDCGDGMGTMRQLMRAGISPDAVNDVFITHRHADHVSGMPHFLFLKFLEKTARVSVYGPAQALKTVRSISFQTHTLDKTRIAFRPLKSGETVALDKNISVTSIRVSLSGQPTCFAYAVNIKPFKVVFSSDMLPNRNFPKLARGADILIHECGGLADNETAIHAIGHSTAKDAAITAAEAGAKYLYLTHLGIKAQIGDGLKYINEAKRYFKGSVRLAHDLMELNCRLGRVL